LSDSIWTTCETHRSLGSRGLSTAEMSFFIPRRELDSTHDILALVLRTAQCLVSSRRLVHGPFVPLVFLPLASYKRSLAILCCRLSKRLPYFLHACDACDAPSTINGVRLPEPRFAYLNNPVSVS
jgi:hypothetical protein